MADSLVLWNAGLWTNAWPTHAAVRGDRRGRGTEVVESRGDPPGGALDVDRRTVMPGLVDAHSHVTSDVSRRRGFGPPPSSAAELVRMVEGGLTSALAAAMVGSASSPCPARLVGVEAHAQ